MVTDDYRAEEADVALRAFGPDGLAQRNEVDPAQYERMRLDQWRTEQARNRPQAT